ncbi:MAG: hypothetical protein AB8E15_10220 [Bdellovibrionales bacterium]
MNKLFLLLVFFSCHFLLANTATEEVTHLDEHQFDMVLGLESDILPDPNLAEFDLRSSSERTGLFLSSLASIDVECTFNAMKKKRGLEIRVNSQTDSFTELLFYQSNENIRGVYDGYMFQDMEKPFMFVEIEGLEKRAQCGVENAGSKFMENKLNTGLKLDCLSFSVNLHCNKWTVN